jgi:hypothetical protein
VTYDDVNGTGQGHSVWVVQGEFKLRAHLPVSDRVSLYGESGVAVTSRHGAKTDDGAIIVEDAHYPALLLGAGLEYQINERWSLEGGFTHSAASRTHNQPETVLLSGGFKYHMAPLPPDRLREASSGGYYFPEQIVQVGYASGVAGFGLNHFLSRTLPIFWQGHVFVDSGLAARYERNVFHSRKIFAFDLGASVSTWQSQQNGDSLLALSVYPLFRFLPIRTRTADVYATYSLAGPTHLSRRVVDGTEVGTNRFTFQDLFGFGVLAGEGRHVVVDVSLAHYSNGNLFPINAGVAVPLTISLGYAF